MPTKGLLRTLIVLEIGLGILSVVVPLLTESALPEPLRNYLQAESEAAFKPLQLLLLLVVVPLIVLFLVSSIGLFLFWRPARLLYLITLVLGTLLTPFFGPYVDAGWGMTLEQAAATLSGVILAMAYFSPLKHSFEKPPMVA